MAPILGYWDVRGLGQFIHCILRYVEEEYEAKFYSLTGPDGSITREGWLKDKFNLGLDFPNLPYYIDGDLKLTQSVAILRHIGSKHGLCGSDENEKAVIDMLMCEALDLRMGLARLCYGDNFEENKPGYIDGVKPKLEALAKFLGSKDFLMGKISAADFIMYESLFCLRKLEPSLIDSHANLMSYIDRFEALPNIKKYMTSEDYIHSPMHAPMAHFGGTKE